MVRENEDGGRRKSSLTFYLRRGDLKAEVGLTWAGGCCSMVRARDLDSTENCPRFSLPFFSSSSHHPLSPLHSVYLLWRNIVCGVSSFITTHFSEW